VQTAVIDRRYRCWNISEIVACGFEAGWRPRVVRQPGAFSGGGPARHFRRSSRSQSRDRASRSRWNRPPLVIVGQVVLDQDPVAVTKARPIGVIAEYIGHNHGADVGRSIDAVVDLRKRRLPGDIATIRVEKRAEQDVIRVIG